VSILLVLTKDVPEQIIFVMNNTPVYTLSTVCNDAHQNLSLSDLETPHNQNVAMLRKL
jgi:hypothetical protein